MSLHLFATIVTPTAVAANNRGEGDGSTLSTLQTITFGNDQYTTVSAEAIRWAYREYFQHTKESEVNRTFDPDADRYHVKGEKIKKVLSTMPSNILTMTYLVIWMPIKEKTAQTNGGVL